MDVPVLGAPEVVGGPMVRVRGALSDLGTRVAGGHALVAIVGAATILRLYKLSAPALWFDESFSLGLIAYPWSEMFGRIADDSVPPLYFIVLKLWCLIFGPSVVALRLFSVVCEVAAVWLCYVFVKETFRNERFALMAALFLAVNPFHIHYSREGRMYGMGVFLVLLSSVLLQRALSRHQRRYWIEYGVTAAACGLTHYYLAFSIAAQGLVAATIGLRLAARSDTRVLRSLGLAAAIAAALFAPWLPAFIEQQERVRADLWMPALTWTAVLRIPWTLILGGTDTDWMPRLGLIAATCGMFLALVAAIVQRRSWADWLIVAQATLPIAAGIALSVERMMFVERYFLFASVFWSVLIAGLISRWRIPALRRATAAALVLVSLAALAKNLNAAGLISIRHPVDRPGVAGAAAFVNQHASDVDAIVVAHSLIYFPFNYYNRTSIRPWLYATIPLEEFPFYAGTAMLTPRDVIYDLDSLAGTRRVWYVWTDGFYQHKFPVPSTWQLLDTRKFDDTVGFKGSIYVELYATQPPPPFKG